MVGEAVGDGSEQRISGRRNRSVLVALLAGVSALTMLLSGCEGGSGSLASATRDAPETPAATLLSVTDGDTIVTSEGIVRIIGIDSPEMGECGYEEASALIAGLVAVGDAVTLEFPEGQNERDRHDRLLRYVSTTDGVDLGLAQIEAGNAVARYDSGDGYPHHPKEAAYHAAQIATLETGGIVVTAACKAAQEAAAGQAAAEAAAAAQAQSAPVPLAEAPAEQPWYLQYPSCAALKRNTVGHPTGPFSRDDPSQVVPPFWHRHPELLWELSALHLHWVASYDPEQSGSGPIAWHTDFALARERLREWVATCGTRIDRDRPTRQTTWPGEEPQPPIEDEVIPNRMEDFVSFVAADVQERQDIEDEFIHAKRAADRVRDGE